MVMTLLRFQIALNLETFANSINSVQILGDGFSESSTTTSMRLENIDQ